MGARTLAPRPPWKGRRIVVGVSGGIAAYKSVQLARDLTRLGAEVDVLMTRSATEFVGPISFEGVTGRPALTSLWSAQGVARHVGVARDADLLIVAPATADLLARAAGGRADDLLTTVLITVRCPVLMAPAMNHRMWTHPQTTLNASHCREALGYELLGPTTGPLAVGEGEGEGRMVEVEEIVERAGVLLGQDENWAGRRVVITSGPTREPLDPVRFLGNRSSGRMGFALAREAALLGARVTVVSGPTALPDPSGVEVRRVETAREMLAATEALIPEADVAIYAAAVADYRPGQTRERKTRKEETGHRMAVELTENPDIARETRSLRPQSCVAVGFALETEELRKRASRKLESKGFHLIVANPAGEHDAGFESDTNRVTLLDRDGGEESLPLMTKAEVAREVLARVTAWLSARDASPTQGRDAS
jgi:phosphopantothenoylcysteine decarboxylase / phosphopantothenate---cysteine ligase